jgi:hypothetical protein
MLSGFLYYSIKKNFFECLIARYADLQKVAQLLPILFLGIPNVGPFLKLVTWVVLSTHFWAFWGSLTSIVKIIVFIHDSLEAASNSVLLERRCW